MRQEEVSDDEVLQLQDQMSKRSAEMSLNKVVNESAAYRHESLVIRRAAATCTSPPRAKRLACGAELPLALCGTLSGTCSSTSANIL